jgi:hypothetical protein
MNKRSSLKGGFMATKSTGMVKGQGKAPQPWIKVRTAEGHKRHMMKQKTMKKK